MKIFLLLAATVILGLPSTSFAVERDHELVFGMSAPFTGANGEMGIEFYRGIMAYFDYLNAHGGAGGWKLSLIPANDGYNPLPCFENTVRFIDEDKVFALFSYVGTPTTTRILPLLQKFENHNVYLLFPLSGAQPLRTTPFGKYVYNLRASYFEESRELISKFISIGRTRIAVFYQNDAYGRTGWDGIRRTLKDHDLSIVSEAAYSRGAQFSDDFSTEATELMRQNPDVILCVGTYAAQGALIRALRENGETIPVAGLSFADSDKMLELLVEAGKESKHDYTANLINTQVIPSYENKSLAGVQLYRLLMQNYKGSPAISGSGYKPRLYSYVSFEGFLNGVLLAELVRRMSDDPNQARIPEIMETITDFDLGIGTQVTFSGGSHQGLHKVYFTSAQDGHFLPLNDWSRWQK